MEQQSSLFDGGDYRLASEPELPPAEPEELAQAVQLDKDNTFVTGDDGLPARKVSLHSLDKAHYAHYYADIVGTAMKTAFPGPLVWFEPFAGPGQLFVKELHSFRAGSALDALNIKTPFDIYVFSDLDPRCAEALNARVGGRPGVHVLQGDANAAELHDRVLELVPRNALLVLYADPQGLDLHFETLRFFAQRYQHLDLLLNFPVPGIDRALCANAARNRQRGVFSQDCKASLVLGHPDPVQLMGPGTARTRTSLREYFERQLATLGYQHFETQPILLHQKRSPLYDLMLASRNPRAKQFFREAQKRGPGGQYTFGF